MSEPLELLTAGEQARQALAETMLGFASANVPEITDADWLPAKDKVDFENPKISLINHSGVNKTIRVVASVAAVMLYFELRNWEQLHFGKYIYECQFEFEQATDTRRKQRLEAKIWGVKEFHAATPNCRAEIEDRAKICRSNTEFAVKNLIESCRSIVVGWFEFVPSEGIQNLSGELEQLASKNISEQLAWFGLRDFISLGI